MNYSMSLLSFTSTAALLVAAPGLDTALVLRTATSEGRRAGIVVALGIGIGCLCWGIAVAVGLGALLHTSPLAFNLLRLAGAVFLFLLGVGLLRGRHSGCGVAPASPRAIVDRSISQAFARGFAGNVLNPKVGLFYLTLLPQFIPAAAPIATFSLILTLIHVGLAIVWFIVLATGAATLAPLLRRPAVARGLDMVTGLVFLGFGAQLALSAA